MSPSSDKQEIIAALRLSRLPGVGAKRFRDLLCEHRTPSRALARYSASLPANIRSKAPLTATQLKALDALPASVWTCYCRGPGYPWLLSLLTEPPPILFGKGPLFPIPPLAVAIVGARLCSEAGATFAFDLAAALAARGVVIVSGGARGIDSAAHWGALEAGGHSVLVTATGVDRVYPPENAALYQQLESRGCIMTELLPGTPPRRDFFPTRNRIITGLSDATVIVEGRSRSGTSSSAHHARRAARLLFAWSKSPDDALAELPRELLGKGAHPLNTPDAETVLGFIKLKSSDRARLDSGNNAWRGDALLGAGS